MHFVILVLVDVEVENNVSHVAMCNSNFNIDIECERKRESGDGVEGGDSGAVEGGEVLGMVEKGSKENPRIP